MTNLCTKRFEMRLTKDEFALCKKIAVENKFIMEYSKKKNKPHLPNLFRKIISKFKEFDTNEGIVTPKHLEELLTHFANLSRLGNNINTLAHEINYLRLKDINHSNGEGDIYINPDDFQKALNEIRKIRKEVVILTKIYTRYMCSERY